MQIRRSLARLDRSDQTGVTTVSQKSLAPSGRGRVGGRIIQGGASLYPSLSCCCPIRGELQKPNEIYRRAGAKRA